ncbi:hypothetical protein DUI87_14253 [Hirundo rustica rustica]|uniref:Uncharacterized protein n=1 Tax=Hirundo rustica rustica TaxID=333673 RepID=A0A3M0K812_HIRRU|nr:hypothetical protein DUI87_14253 [Hirundo rustica rustica]
MKASGVRPPALHVEAAAGILKRLGHARRHEAIGQRHFRATRVVSRREKMPPRGRWRPRGAYLRHGEAVKVMPSEPGCASIDQRPSRATTAELLTAAEPQPEEFSYRNPAVSGLSSDVFQNGLGTVPWLDQMTHYGPSHHD